MPLPRQNKIYANFAGGLITEASKLAYPDGASTILQNVLLFRNGTASRRLGIDLEENARKSTDTLTDAEVKDVAITVHPWLDVNGDGTKEYVVVQFGDTIYVHDKHPDGYNSANGVLAYWNYEPLTVDSSSTAWKEEPLESTVGLGRFFACNKYIAPFYIEESSGTFTVKKLSLTIRDIDGLDETNDTSTADTTAPTESDAHLIKDTEDLIAGTNTTTSWTMSTLSTGAAY